MDQPLKTPSHGGLNKPRKPAGIDTTVFKPHSTRGAATSAAKAANVPIQEIMNTAGWRSVSILAKFYNRPIRSDKNFAEAVLSSTSL